MTRHRFRFVVLGRYRSPVLDNEHAVTVNVIAGEGEHLTYAGTLTLAESDWNTLAGALKYSLRDDVEIDDRHPAR